MPDIDSGVQTFPLAGALLTAQLVAQLTQAVQDAHTQSAFVIDAQQLTGVTPMGLSALLELGHRTLTRTPPQPLALAGLSRALTRTAIEAGLAQRFGIFASVEAFVRAHARTHAAAQPELQRCAL